MTDLLPHREGQGDILKELRRYPPGEDYYWYSPAAVARLIEEARREEREKLLRVIDAQKAVQIWYMRDNFTFKALPLEVEQAIEILRNERDAGYTYGMLCGRPVGVTPPVLHAGGEEEWDSFEDKARLWIAAVIEKTWTKEELDQAREEALELARDIQRLVK